MVLWTGSAVPRPLWQILIQNHPEKQRLPSELSGSHAGACIRHFGKTFPHRSLAQVFGGLAGAGVLALIATGQDGFTFADGFASNGYGENSPRQYALVSCLVAEVVLTFAFLFIILGATDKRAPAGFAPIAIGLGLTLIHLIGIPVTNLSVNPARSTGPAVFVGGWAFNSFGFSGSLPSRVPHSRELSTPWFPSNLVTTADCCLRSASSDTFSKSGGNPSVEIDVCLALR